MSIEETVNDILDELERELEQLERIRKRVITIPIPRDCGELQLMTMMQENEQ